MEPTFLNPFHLNKSGIYFAAIGEAVETNQETVRRGIWRCSICTFDNDESMSACDICGVLRYPLVNIHNNNDTKTGINELLYNFFYLYYPKFGEVSYCVD